ncbi:hypothetical protein N9D34_02150 [Salibacteraceae bacterium]|nr:hypothetical protein [Salibacteraceae bacterium]
MKKLILAMTILISASALNAQKFGASPEDSLECIKNMSLYQDYYRQKQYDESLKYWKNVFTYCPKVSKGIYIKGARLYEKKIKKTKEDKELKELLIDTLMMVYDSRIEHFGERGIVLGRKAADLIQHRPSEVEAAYKMFEESLQLQGNDMEAGALVYMYQTKYKMFKNELTTKDELINLYPKLKAIADYNVKNSTREKDRENYKKTGDNLLEFFKQVADCDDLVKAFTPRYEKDPENIEQLKEILSLLNTKECEDADFYITIAKKLQEKEPSALAAWSIANWYVKKKDCPTAIPYYEEAFTLADNMEDKDEVAPFKVKAILRAGLCQLSAGQYSSAKQKALKALSIDPNSGDAYMMLGDAYLGGASTWGENPCEKGAGYWAAVDKYQIALKYLSRNTVTYKVQCKSCSVSYSTGDGGNEMKSGIKGSWEKSISVNSGASVAINASSDTKGDKVRVHIFQNDKLEKKAESEGDFISAAASYAVTSSTASIYSKIQTAKSRYPEKSECFFIGKNEGDEIKVGSWINETTKVRF